MIEYLESLDKQLLLFINGGNNPVLDTIMIWISNKKSWIIYYILIAAYLIHKHKIKALWIILGVILTVLITDVVSTQLFKETIQRYRPCHNEELKSLLHLINNKCGGMYGFFSSHASNTAGLASFLIFSKAIQISSNPLAKAIGISLIVYVFVNSYSRVYLGVHYPSDVIAGILFGSMIGYMNSKILLKFIKIKL